MSDRNLDNESKSKDKNLGESSNSLLSDAYDLVQEHPLASGVAAGAALLAGAYLMRGRFSGQGRLLGEVENAGKEIFKHVDEIPDVLRPGLRSLSTKEVPAVIARAGDDYLVTLNNVKGMSRSATLEPGETMQSFAQDLLKRRSGITGEFVNEKNIGEETTRLLGLNKRMSADKIAARAQEIIVHDDASLRALGEKAQFKHVPQLGQFLKQFGVTEEQIQTAFNIQKAQAPAERQLLGQILKDNKLASNEQVESAFTQQNEMKAYLRQVLETVFK